MKLLNNTYSDFGLSYQTVMNNQSYTIHSGITRPCQFSLENIPTMNGITVGVYIVMVGMKYTPYLSWTDCNLKVEVDPG